MCWTEIEAVAVGVLGEGRLTLAGLRECFALRIRRILGKECTLAEETGPANAEKHESKWSTRSAGGSWSGGLWHWLILGTLGSLPTSSVSSTVLPALHPGKTLCLWVRVPHRHLSIYLCMSCAWSLASHQGRLQ